MLFTVIALWYINIFGFLVWPWPQPGIIFVCFKHLNCLLNTCNSHVALYLAWVSIWLVEETFGTKFWSNWSQRAQVNTYSNLFVNNSLSTREMLTTVYVIKNHLIYLSLPKCKKLLRKKILNVLRCFSVSAKTSTRKYMSNQKVQWFFWRFLKNFRLTKAFYLKISYSCFCKYRFYFSNFVFLNIHLTIHFLQTWFMGTGLLFYTLVKSLTR